MKKSFKIDNSAKIFYIIHRKMWIVMALAIFFFFKSMYIFEEKICINFVNLFIGIFFLIINIIFYGLAYKYWRCPHCHKKYPGKYFCQYCGKELE